VIRPGEGRQTILARRRRGGIEEQQVVEARKQSGKQRGFVRALLHGERPAIQIGKAGVTPSLVSAVDEALAAREMIKVRVARTCPVTPDEAAACLAGQLGAEVVGVSGRTVLLHRPTPKDE
jgi:RNA-binding protein